MRHLDDIYRIRPIFLGPPTTQIAAFYRVPQGPACCLALLVRRQRGAQFIRHLASRDLPPMVVRQRFCSREREALKTAEGSGAPVVPISKRWGKDRLRKHPTPPHLRK